MDILHFDLNGNNCLLSKPKSHSDVFHAKVSDFGLSRVHVGQHTVATHSYGTVRFAPTAL
jgi:serine/threonine protein kinase